MSLFGSKKKLLDRDEILKRLKKVDKDPLRRQHLHPKIADRLDGGKSQPSAVLLPLQLAMTDFARYVAGTKEGLKVEQTYAAVERYMKCYVDALIDDEQLRQRVHAMIDSQR